MKSLIIFLVLSRLFSIESFGSAVQDYLGSWEEQNGFSNAIVIESDGTFRANIYDWGWQRLLPISGTWSFANDRMEFDFTDPSYPDYATIDANGNLRWHYIRDEQNQHHSFRTLAQVDAIQKLPVQLNQRQFRIYPVDTQTIPTDTIKVLLSGHVTYPGLYYWPKDKTVADLIQFAVPLKLAVTRSYSLYREVNGTLKELSISLPKGSDFQLRNGDCIHISYIPL